MTDARERTLEEVRAAGLEALSKELGPADFLRFLQMFQTGQGDYTAERRAWLDALSEEDIHTGIDDLRRRGQLRSERTG